MYFFREDNAIHYWISSGQSTFPPPLLDSLACSCKTVIETDTRRETQKEGVLGKDGVGAVSWPLVSVVLKNSKWFPSYGLDRETSLWWCKDQLQQLISKKATGDEKMLTLWVDQSCSFIIQLLREGQTCHTGWLQPSQKWQLMNFKSIKTNAKKANLGQFG